MNQYSLEQLEIILEDRLEYSNLDWLNYLEKYLDHCQTSFISSTEALHELEHVIARNQYYECNYAARHGRQKQQLEKRLHESRHLLEIVEKVPDLQFINKSCFRLVEEFSTLLSMQSEVSATVLIKSIQYELRDFNSWAEIRQELLNCQSMKEMATKHRDLSTRSYCSIRIGLLTNKLFLLEASCVSPIAANRLESEPYK